MSHRPIRRLCLPLLLLLLSYSLPLGAVRRTIHLSDYGLRAGTKESCTPLMRKILGDLRRELQSEGDTLELLFAPGRYHFASQGAAERVYYISNHDHPGSRPIGLLLEGWRNVILRGEGSELLFEDRMLPFVLDSCRGVEHS